MLKNKRLLLLLIILLTVAVSILVFAYVTSKNVADKNASNKSGEQCSFENEGMINICGWFQDTQDGSRKHYYVKIVSFANGGELMNAALDFGGIKTVFPVGKIGRDKLNIVSDEELRIRDENGMAFMNMVEIREDL